MSFCSDCEKPFSAFEHAIDHLTNKEQLFHALGRMCDECEEDISSFYCESCDQLLCRSCDKSIHNKGKRALHQRSNADSQFNLSAAKKVHVWQLEEILSSNKNESQEKPIQQLLEDRVAKLFTNEEQIASNATSIILVFYSQEQLSMAQQVNFSPNLFNKTSSLVLVDEINLFACLANLLAHSNAQIDLMSLDSESLLAQKIAQFIYSKEHQKAIDKFGESYLLNNEHQRTACTEQFSVNDEEDDEYNRGKGADIAVAIQKQEKKLTQEKVGVVEQETNSNQDSSVLSYLSSSLQQTTTEEKKTDSSLNKSNNNSLDDSLLQNAANYRIISKTNCKRYWQKNNLEFYQPYKNIRVLGSIKMSHFIQQEMIKYAHKGELLILRTEFLSKFSAPFKSKFKKSLDDALKKAEEIKVIHSTIRHFPDTDPLEFIGLQTDILTIESLCWVIKSIKNDLMTPTEKLVLSRIKESFGLKIDHHRWKEIIDFIAEHQSNMYISLCDTNESYEDQEENKSSNMDDVKNKQVFPLKVEHLKDQANKIDTQCIYLKYNRWIPEDQGQINTESLEWQTFLSFLEEFYKEEDNDTNRSWNSSVDNILNRSTVKKENKTLRIPEETKAIPGGRYGCAQFIKICGPTILQALSIGKLSLFVQESINKGIIKYQKTLLIKPSALNSQNNISQGNINTSQNLNDKSMNSESLNISNQNMSFTEDLRQSTELLSSEAPATNGSLSQKCLLIRENIIEILKESEDGGVSLAQIPLLLRKKLKYPVNFQELGYPKLKNFLQSVMNDIIYIDTTTNQHQARFRQKPAVLNPNKDTLTNISEISQTEEFTSTTITSDCGTANSTNEEEKNLSNKENRKVQFTKKFFPSSDSKSNENKTNIFPRKKVSTLDDYLDKIKTYIKEILKENCFGMSLQNLFKQITIKLGFEFDCKIFNCNNFYEFLLQKTDEIVDIEVRKNMTIVYPKNYRFGPQNLINPIDQNPMMMHMNNSNTNGISGFNSSTTPLKADHNVYYTVNSNNNINMISFKIPNYNRTEIETPPGLEQGQRFNSNNGLNNANGGMAGNNNQQQSNHIRRISGSIGFSQGFSNPHHHKRGSSNVISISPILFYGNDDDENQNEGFTAISNLNSAFHSRAGSKFSKAAPVEESNIEINDNLKFIEELLEDKKDMSSLSFDKNSSMQNPDTPTNLEPSFSEVSSINQSNTTHMKTQSEDWKRYNKNWQKSSSYNYFQPNFKTPTKMN